jgi:type I restriction enzyme M protein
MSTKVSNLVSKLWSYCNILRDDGLSYSDYVEQLTYLLFLKMADEHSKPPFLHLAPLPKSFNWSSLITKRDEDQLEHYERILRRLSQRKDLFGTIYKNALSKFRDPSKFQRLVNELNLIEWTEFDSDVKGDAYEGLIERTASDGKAGAGQYFTPRPLVEAIVEVMNLLPKQTICDPACGTGGFLLEAYKQIASQKLKPDELQSLNHESIHGVELVDSVARLCLMNLVLHGVGGHESPLIIGDSLEMKPDKTFDVVLANPPFGKKSSVTFTNEASDKQKESLVVNRRDFWASTSNKQLNFLQHIFTILNENGRAAVVIPDNVLFEAGAGETIRRMLLKQTDVHTLLRLPTGIFYAQGVKANVLFFDRKPNRAEPWTKKLWVYDLRTNLHFTLKEKTLKRKDLNDFVSTYNSNNRLRRNESERLSGFTYEELLKRDKMNLDIFWLKDESLEDSSNLPEPGLIASEIIDDLQAALDQFAAIAGDLKL